MSPAGQGSVLSSPAPVSSPSFPVRLGLARCAVSGRRPGMGACVPGVSRDQKGAKEQGGSSFSQRTQVPTTGAAGVHMKQVLTECQHQGSLCQAWGVTDKEEPHRCRIRWGHSSTVCSALQWARPEWPGLCRGCSGAGTDVGAECAGTCDLADCTRTLCSFLSAGVTRGQTRRRVRLEPAGP